MDDGVSKVVEDAYHQYLDLEFGKKMCTGQGVRHTHQTHQYGCWIGMNMIKLCHSMDCEITEGCHKEEITFLYTVFV